MKVVVFKFGGSSVENAKQLLKVRKIVTSYHKLHKVVVVSAPKGMTDDLFKVAKLRKEGGDWQSLWGERVVERFREIVTELKLELNVEALFTSAYEQIASGQASLDYIASRGEAIHSQIVATWLGAKHVEAAQVLRFQADGKLNEDWTYDLIQREMSEPRLYVVGGFYGSAADSSVHTFGRGGSDETGSHLAAALQAERYLNFTNTNGVLVTDPRVVKPHGTELRTIRRMTFVELWELAAAGAKVMYPGAVVPVAKAGIPLWVKNTDNPKHSGTLIQDNLPEVKGCRVTGLAGDHSFTTFVIEKVGMNAEFGFGAHILQVFRRTRVPYSHSVDGMDLISVVVASSELKKPGKVELIVQELLEAGGAGTKVQVWEKDMATICLVARGLDKKPDVPARLFIALAKAGISALTVSKGRTGVSYMVGVSNALYKEAMQAIYNEFFN